MTSKKHTAKQHNSRGREQPSGGIRPVRVRSKRLDEIQEDKLALAFYLIARNLVDDRTEDGAIQDESPPPAVEHTKAES